MAEEHGIDFRAWYNDLATEKDLKAAMASTLMAWIPLEVKDEAELKRVKLNQLLYIGANQNGEGDIPVRPDFKNNPELIINNAKHPHRTIVSKGKDLKPEHFLSLRSDMTQILYAMYDDRRDPMFDMARGFREGNFYDKHGKEMKPHEILKHIEPKMVLEIHRDPVAYLKAQYPNDWEAMARTITGCMVPVPRTHEDLYANATDHYTVHRNGVPYQIARYDPASLICDPQLSVAGRVYPRAICLMPDDIRPSQMIIISAMFGGQFNIHSRREMELPKWTSKTRRTGEFVTSIKPGSNRSLPVNLLPNNTGHTKFDVLFAYGHSVPNTFEPERVPENRFTMAIGQQATNPYWLGGKEFLDAEDRFIAAGPLHTIPQSKVTTGKQLNLKRCHLCQW